MFEVKLALRDKIDPQKVRELSVVKIILGMERAADLFVGKLRAFSLTGAGGIAARSGMLAKEWEAERDSGDPLTWRFRNRLPYARILEKGGVIVPKKAGALTIPIPGGPAMTDRGVSRYPGGARQAEAEGHKLFIPKGKNYLAEHVGKDQLVAWYALRQSVTIPAFGYASKAIKAVKPDVVRELRRAIMEKP